MSIFGRLRKALMGCRPLFAMAYAVRMLQQRLLLWISRTRHPLDAHLVMFDSFQSNHFNDSPKALYESLVKDKQYGDFQCVWVLRHPDKMMDLPAHPRTRIVVYNSADYRRVLSTAGWIVTNSMMPPFYRKRKGQVLIQTWHGTPLKRLGCDITTDCNAHDTVKVTHKRYRDQAAQFSYLLSPSPFCTEKLTSAFDLVGLRKTDIIVEEGYPRNDRLVNTTPEEVDAVRERLHIPFGKKVVLYAPTYRDNQQENGEFVYHPPINFDKMIRTFGENVIWLFRAHYFVSNQMDFSQYGSLVRNVGDVEDINDLYLISDLLITDYSSVFFDYAILHKPILFYMYDKEAYQQDLRDFYLDLSVLPGKIVEQQEELIDAVSELLDNFRVDDRYLTFCDRFNGKEDGQAARRVWKKIFEREKQNTL